jgi:hypothetical protein
MGTNDGGELLSAARAPGRFHKQIAVAGEHNAPQPAGAIQQWRIISIGCAIFRGRQHVHAPAPQAAPDGGRHVLVHVKGKTHRAHVRHRHWQENKSP